ncbi:hypothetical protein B0H16DRAFT_1688079 [Mycena metata]|uniref:Uncharacterized protein n=1 Tax=Mycena metata TaxID=1033252 RepID=A0AAD7JEB9_9AGAR|nr:hypothetical protein B0H16DRAFT_1688079 [Mycena metata]
MENTNTRGKKHAAPLHPRATWTRRADHAYGELLRTRTRVRERTGAVEGGGDGTRRRGGRARTGSAAARSARRGRMGMRAGPSSGLLFIEFRRAVASAVHANNAAKLLTALHGIVCGTGGAGGQSHRQGGLGGPGEGPIVNSGRGYIEINHGIKKEGMNTSGVHRGHSRIWSPKHAGAQVARAPAPKPPAPGTQAQHPRPKATGGAAAVPNGRQGTQAPVPHPTTRRGVPTSPAALSPSRSIRAACGVRSKRGKTRQRRPTSGRSGVVPVRAARCTSPPCPHPHVPAAWGGVRRASHKTTRVVPVHTAAACVCGRASRARRPHPAPPALYACIHLLRCGCDAENEEEEGTAWVEWNKTNAPRGACTSGAPAHKPYKHPRPRGPSGKHKHPQDHAPPAAAYTPPPYTPAPSISIRRQLQARASVPKRQVPKRKRAKEEEPREGLIGAQRRQKRKGGRTPKTKVQGQTHNAERDVLREAAAAKWTPPTGRACGGTARRAGASSYSRSRGKSASSGERKRDVPLSPDSDYSSATYSSRSCSTRTRTSRTRRPTPRTCPTRSLEGDTDGVANGARTAGGIGPAGAGSACGTRSAPAGRVAAARAAGAAASAARVGGGGGEARRGPTSGWTRRCSRGLVSRRWTVRASRRGWVAVAVAGDGAVVLIRGHQGGACPVSKVVVRGGATTVIRLVFKQEGGTTQAPADAIC